MKTPDFNINDPVSGPIDLPCNCGAKKGEKCKSADGRRREGFHQPRYDLFNRTKQYQDGLKK